MSVRSEFVKANSRYTTSFAKTSKGSLPMPPGRKVAVLTCMDARLDPAKFLGLQEGDAHVVRNAGGRASDDAIRSLVISEQLLGTEEIFVIHHTDCGMLTFSNDDLRRLLKERLSADASRVDFLPFRDLAQSVRDDVEELRRSPLIPHHVRIHGYIYDVKSGRLQEVVSEEEPTHHEAVATRSRSQSRAH